MHGHISAGFFLLFLQGKHNGFCHIVASARSEFFEQVANFDAFICIITKNVVLSSNNIIISIIK